MEDMSCFQRAKRIIVSRQAKSEGCKVLPKVSSNTAREALETTASTFPFLDLPAKLRLRTYTYVLAGHQIHIDIHEPYDLDDIIHTICAAPSCITYHYNHHSRCHSRAHKLNTALLHVCQQIFDEARLTLYMDNTFVFMQARTMLIFMRKITPEQGRAISDLQIIPSLFSEAGLVTWQRSCERAVSVLPNLTSFALCSTVIRPAVLRRLRFERKWMGNFLSLGLLQLRHVVIEITDQEGLKLEGVVEQAALGLKRKLLMEGVLDTFSDGF
ncbi:MAG: hypothetical protein M1830_000335 [Pleopsidium flavum]|nr:MAG: hypothetical protein M1830_000335 [Pleopsidium flavum]